MNSISDQNRIDAAIKLLQDGIEQPRNKGQVIEVIVQKVDNEIPIGADLATFSGRKRAMQYGFMMHVIGNLLQTIMALLLTFVMIIMMWSGYPELTWYAFAIISASFVWLYVSFKETKTNWILYQAVKPIQQQQADAQPNVATQRVERTTDLA